MPSPVDRVTIHHEGAGKPSDVPRGAAGGYTYWVGSTRWEHLRDVWHSYATLRFNHVSLDICLSGNRMSSIVTDADVGLIRGAFMDARARGYVTADPVVVAHRDSPGSSTVCPGDLTMARWPVVAAACRDMPRLAESVLEGPLLYPSKTQTVPNRFRGAQVDLAKKHVALLNAAECDPVPVVNNPNPWIGSFGGVGEFTIVTADLNEYHFVLS